MIHEDSQISIPLNNATDRVPAGLNIQTNITRPQWNIRLDLATALRHIQVPRGFARAVASATKGSSGQ